MEAKFLWYLIEILKMMVWTPLRYGNFLVSHDVVCDVQILRESQATVNPWPQGGWGLGDTCLRFQALVSGEIFLGGSGNFSTWNTGKLKNGWLEDCVLSSWGPVSFSGAELLFFVSGSVYLSNHWWIFMAMLAFVGGSGDAIWSISGIVDV